MKRAILVPALVGLYAVALVFAYTANAQATHVPGIAVHGPHCQDGQTKTQVALTIAKTDVLGVPGAPVGFAPFTFGAVETRDNSWAVTGTAVGSTPQTSGTWAGFSASIDAFDGNKSCELPTTTTTEPPTTTTTLGGCTENCVPTPPPPAATTNPCEADGTCSDVPHQPSTETASSTGQLPFTGPEVAGIPIEVIAGAALVLLALGYVLDAVFGAARIEPLKREVK